MTSVLADFWVNNEDPTTRYVDSDWILGGSKTGTGVERHGSYTFMGVKCYDDFWKSGGSTSNNEYGQTMSVFITKENFGENKILVKSEGGTGVFEILEIPLFGYQLIAINANPIDRDEEALLIFSQQHQGFVDVYIHTKFGRFSYTKVLVEGEFITESTGKSLFRYEVEDFLKGFFMELFIMEDKSWVNLAFDGGDSQICFDGVLDWGYSQYYPFLVDNLEIKDLDCYFYPSLQFSSQELKQFLRNKQGIDLFIERSGDFNSMEQSLLSINQYKYGVSHEGWGFDLAYPAELPDDYWEPYTCIDIGIYRYLPSESQIKSDLQYYNKDRIRNERGYIRDILAYNMVCHGGPEWYINTGDGIVYPEEVEDLWYYYYNLWTNEEVDVPDVRRLFYWGNWSFRFPRQPFLDQEYRLILKDFKFVKSISFPPRNN